MTNGQGDVEEESPTTEAPPRKPEPSQSQKAYDPDRHVTRDRYTLVSKIMEGLRGDAFLIARDMGIAACPCCRSGLPNLPEHGILITINMFDQKKILIRLVYFDYFETSLFDSI